MEKKQVCGCEGTVAGMGCHSIAFLCGWVSFFLFILYAAKLSYPIFSSLLGANGLQLPEGGDFEALHCQPSRKFDRCTKLDLTTEPPLLGRCCWAFVLLFLSSVFLFSYPKPMVFVKKHHIKYIVFKISNYTLFSLNMHRTPRNVFWNMFWVIKI